jgi:hypothetical protein
MIITVCIVKKASNPSHSNYINSHIAHGFEQRRTVYYGIPFLNICIFVPLYTVELSIMIVSVDNLEPLSFVALVVAVFVIRNCWTGCIVLQRRQLLLVNNPAKNNETLGSAHRQYIFSVPVASARDVMFGAESICVCAFLCAPHHPLLLLFVVSRQHRNNYNF